MGMPSAMSALNVYNGYTEVVADGYQRDSVYVEIDDGCRVAVDVLQPTLAGEPLPGQRPTVLLATGYRRAFYKGEQSFNAPKYQKYIEHLPVGALVTAYEQRPMCKQVIHYGYNVVCMDFRGTGASFGTDAGGAWRNAADVAQVVDWIAAQTWASDKVGMIGGSWEGVVQLMAAAFQPKHLACIVPQIPPSIANGIFDGGLFISGFAADWSAMRKGQDTQEQAAPVDGPEGQALFEQAVAQRQAVYIVPDAQSEAADPAMQTRDVSERTGREGAPDPAFPELGPLRDAFDEFERISRSGTAVYIQTGWWDMTFPGDCMDLHSALTCPKRILIGPWNHGVLPDVEPLRWFDYWLKGIDNGIMDEAPVVISTSDPDGVATWKGAQAWPLPEVANQNWHLSAQASGCIDSAYDGSLSSETGSQSTPADYQVDYDVTMGDCDRMRFMLRDVVIRHPDLVERARKCMTFTGPVIETGMDITGSPTLHLQLQTSASSGAVFATLEAVLPDGDVFHITEGWLNLEHRKISRCPRPHAGSAWHSQRSEDLLPVVPGEWMQVGLELYPVSVHVPVGSRLRLTLAGCDKGNLHVPELEPVPQWQLMTGGDNGSLLELPVEQVSERPAGRVLKAAFAGQDPGYAFARE